MAIRLRQILFALTLVFGLLPWGLSAACENRGSPEATPSPQAGKLKIDDAVFDAFWGGHDKVSSIARISSQRSESSTGSSGEDNSLPIPGGYGVVRVENAGELTDLFRNRSGWIGGDGDYSIPLSPGKTLWVYGDSFLGEIKEGKRCKGFRIVNNALALQDGNNPNSAVLEFYSGRNERGEPCAVIVPEDGRGWFWIYDGIRSEDSLYLFLIQADREVKSGLGFKSIGMSLGIVKNPDSSPEHWKIIQKKIPWAQFSADGDTFPGSAILEEKGLFYIYGIHEEKSSGFLEKHLIVARVSRESLADFKRWEFFDGNSWQADFSNLRSLAGGFANEFTVSYQRTLSKYVIVYTESGASENIQMRIAGRPEGPWSEPVTIYRCPEKSWHKNILIYAAKAHPSLSENPSELIVSYITNSLDFSDLLNDARLYQPQFLKLTFSK